MSSEFFIQLIKDFNFYFQSLHYLAKSNPTNYSTYSLYNKSDCLVNLTVFSTYKNLSSQSHEIKFLNFNTTYSMTKPFTLKCNTFYANEINLLVFIPSAPQQFKHRQAIRESWASKNVFFLCFEIMS